jgi:ABC-2 type transport system ATP-binding protein
MITIENVDLHPPIAQTTSLRATVKRLWSPHETRHFPVLTDINLDLPEGTRLGLLGPNGAGKSSLLRMIAGIYEPTSGRISRSGKILTLFDLGFGMDDEANGYENLEIAGALLGISARDVRRRVPEIEEFSDLGEALERPLKSYSAGMRVRLAFSLVTSVDADCLLIDEIIGVGDAAFLKKAKLRMQQQMERTKVVVLASHANDVLSSFCTTGIVMMHGKVLFHGKIDKAIEYYTSIEG